jgi:hypothetical protein
MEAVLSQSKEANQIQRQQEVVISTEYHEKILNIKERIKGQCFI